MAYSRQVVLLPGGVAYWTVLDGSFERVQPFDDFLRYLRIDRGRAEKTTRQYSSTFVEWAAWLAARRELGDLVAAAESLGSFKFHLSRTVVRRTGSGQGRPRSPERVDDMLAAIRSLYRWAIARGRVEARVNGLLYEIVEARGAAVAWMEDPPEYIARPVHRSQRSGSGVPMRVAFEEFEAMLQAPGSLRDKLLVCLLGLEAIRVEEAVTLRRSAMHLALNSTALGCAVKGPHLHVAGKGNKRRWLPAHPYLVVVYSQHLLERSAVPAADRSDYVLCNIAGGVVGAPMTTGRARKSIMALARRAGIERHVTPHQFRHGLATELLEQGRSLDEIQRLLGHASVETTRRYARTTDRRLVEAVNSVEIPRRLP